MNYELWDDWVVQADLERPITHMWSRTDGEALSESVTVDVETRNIEFGEEVLLAAYPAGWHLETPQHRPLALLEDALQLPTKPGAGKLRIVRSRYSRRPLATELTALTWDEPARWRPAAVGDDQTGLLPPTLGLVIGLGRPEQLVPNLQEGVELLDSEGLTPGGPRRLGRARRRREHEPHIDLPSWTMPSEVARFGLTSLLERAFETGPEDEAHVGPLYSGAATTIVISDLPSMLVPGVRTIWEAVTSDGEVCGMAIVPSDEVDLLEHASDPWSLEGELAPPRTSPRTLSGEQIDRLGSRPSQPGVWAGAPFTVEFEDTGETYSGQITMRLLGRIILPSRQIVLADPSAPDIGRRLVELELDHAGPYPVIELTIRATGEDRGLLVPLGPGEPTRWAEAPTPDGENADPIVNTGQVAIVDSAGVERLTPRNERYDLLLWQLAGDVTLLRTDPSARPDAASMTGIGGDVPVFASIGLDEEDRPVALLLDSFDLTAVGADAEA